MKSKNSLLLSMMLAGTLCMSACVDDTTSIIEEKKYPLTAFAVQVSDSYYHGKIDQTTGRVEIGTLEQTDYITKVD